MSRSLPPSPPHPLPRLAYSLLTCPLARCAISSVPTLHHSAAPFLRHGPATATPLTPYPRRPPRASRRYNTFHPPRCVFTYLSPSTSQRRPPRRAPRPIVFPVLGIRIYRGTVRYSSSSPLVPHPYHYTAAPPPHPREHESERARCQFTRMADGTLCRKVRTPRSAGRGEGGEGGAKERCGAERADWEVPGSPGAAALGRAGESDPRGASVGWRGLGSAALDPGPGTHGEKGPLERRGGFGRAGTSRDWWG